jgi:hypothetical protein
LIHRHYPYDLLQTLYLHKNHYTHHHCLKSLSTRFLNPSTLSPLHVLAAMIPTEVSELIRTKKLFFVSLYAMCGARLGKLQTSHVSISLQDTFKQHLWPSHWTTCSYIEPCSIASGGCHMIYTANKLCDLSSSNDVNGLIS